MDLWELLDVTGICGITDPRDKVFGLLGLINDIQALDLTPDYELMTREVYIGVAVYLMKIHHCCDLTQHANPYWMYSSQLVTRELLWYLIMGPYLGYSRTVAIIPGLL